MNKKYIFLRNAMYMIGGVYMVSGIILLICNFDHLQRFLISSVWWKGFLILLSIVLAWVMITTIFFTLADFINEYIKEHPYTKRINRRTIEFK